MEYETLKTSQGKIISGPILIRPKLFRDNRGFFFESWNQKSWINLLKENGQQNTQFLQDNHSASSIGVLRGLHYQLPPKAQAKLVRCVVGEIFDVAVDLRIGSSTQGQWVGAYLNADNRNQLWIPAGFAHGFLTLSNQAEVLYKTTDFWDARYERSILWNDPNICIDWPLIKFNNQIIEPTLSPKDANAPFLSSVKSIDLFN